MGSVTNRVLLEEIHLYTIQVIGQTPYGDDIHGDSDLGVWPASVTPSTLSESEIGRDAFINLYDFVVEPECPVDGVDSVEWRGDRYEVVGDPKKHYVKTILHHIEFQGRLIKGG